MERIRWPALILGVALAGALAWTYALIGTWFCDATCPEDLGPFQTSAVGGALVGLTAAVLSALALCDRGRLSGRAALCLSLVVWVGFVAYLLAFDSARPY